jgi:hypothetical protein
LRPTARLTVDATLFKPWEIARSLNPISNCARVYTRSAKFNSPHRSLMQHHSKMKYRPLTLIAAYVEK